MRKLGIGLALIALPATLASAQSMPVSAFIAKAEALRKKGPFALMSRDMGVLKAEIGNSSKLLRAETQAAAKSGRQLEICLPAKASIKSNELIAYLQALPAAQQTMPFHHGFRGFVKTKYPCAP